MMHVGDIFSTVGGVQYRGDIMRNVGNILSTVGGVQYREEGFMSTMGVILSSMEDTQYRWGIS